MAKYYPIMLNIENKKCVIVGGGEIAHRKILELLEYGANITVVSISINENIKVLVDNKSVYYIQNEYNKEYLEKAYIVVASTNDSNVNNQVFIDATQKEILVNVVDDSKNCSFIVPSKIKRGDLTIAISTNGKSPTLSRIIKEELEIKYDEDYEAYVNILGEIRGQIIDKVKDPSKKKEIFNTIIKEDYLKKIKLFGKEAVLKEVREYLENTQ